MVFEERIIIINVNNIIIFSLLRFVCKVYIIIFSLFEYWVSFKMWNIFRRWVIWGIVKDISWWFLLIIIVKKGIIVIKFIKFKGDRRNYSWFGVVVKCIIYLSKNYE